MELLLAPFRSATDVAAFAVFVLVFPCYHSIYPWFSARRPGATALGHLDRMRRSWVEGLIQRRDVIAAAQQTRNLTMVNTLLASSAVIVMGVTANLLLEVPARAGPDGLLPMLQQDPRVPMAKLMLVLLILAFAFGSFLGALRAIGQFNIVIGADPAIIDEVEGSAVGYCTGLAAAASHRYTIGVRAMISAFPLFLWIVDVWLFLAVTVVLGVRYVGLIDFARRRRVRPSR